MGNGGIGSDVEGPTGFDARRLERPGRCRVALGPGPGDLRRIADRPTSDVDVGKLVVAGDGVRFGLPEVRRSLLAAAGGLTRLRDVVGEKLALEIALTGEPFSAQRMYDIGLVNRVVARDKVVDEAISLAETICANAPLAVRGERNVVLGARNLDDAERVALEKQEAKVIYKSQDFKEGPKAFIEKRAPEWVGR